MRLATTFALLLAVACSGSSDSKNIENSGENTDRGGEKQPESDERKIRRAQLASCGPMCERLIDCSIEDLRANKTDAEIAEMQLEEVVPRAVEDCKSECTGLSLSPRQIRVVQDCVNGPQECSEYVSCLDKAKRGQGS